MALPSPPIAQQGGDIDVDQLYRRIALLESRSQDPPSAIKNASVVLLGDSITDICNGLRPSGAFAAPAASSYWVWANAELGWRFDNVINAGVSGNTLVQMSARYATDVAPFNPRVLVVEGGTNDVLQTTSLNYDAKYSDAKTALNSILSKAAATNAIICLVTVGPLGSAVAATADQLNQRARLNQYMRLLASTTDGVVLADWDAGMTDPTTNGKPIGEADGKFHIYNDDLVHPNGAGATLMGKRIAAALRPFVGANNAYIPRGLTPNQHLTNPSFAGASGATAPTSWTFSSLSTPTTTAAHSYEARTDGLNGQQLVIAMTATGVMPSAQYQNFTTFAGGLLSVGDKVRCALEIDTLDVATQDSQIGLYFAGTTAGVAVVSETNVMHDAAINGGGATKVVNTSGALPASMVLMTDALTVTATVVAFLVKIRLGGTQRFKLKSCVVFKVPS